MGDKKILKFSIITIPLIVLMFTLFTGVIPVSAPPPPPACGDTVTTDIVLTADLVCAGTPGLIIGARGITIDLNGHTITGTACAFCHGIRNGDFSATTNPSTTLGFNHVTIQNGKIIGFEQGIRGDTVNGFTIKNMVIAGQTSSNAIDILDSRHVVIKDTLISITTVSPFIEAIRLQNDANVRVERVHVDGGAVGVNFGCGICDGTEKPTNGFIVDSTFVNNGNAIFLPSATRAVVRDNFVTGSSGSAILVGLQCFAPTFPRVTNIEISGNVVSNNGGTGITLCGADNSIVSNNLVTENVGVGGGGIRLLDADNNDITKNIVFLNTDFDMLQDSSSTGNSWNGNLCLTESEAGSGPIDC